MENTADILQLVYIGLAVFVFSAGLGLFLGGLHVGSRLIK